MPFLIHVIRTLKTFSVQMLLLSLLLLTLLWTLLLQDLKANEDRETREDRRQIENLTELGMQTLQSSVRTVDLLLLHLRQRWPDPDKDFAEEVRQHQTDGRIGFRFDIGLVDADGRWLFSSALPAAEQTNLSQDPDFLALRDSGQDQLLLSPASPLGESGAPRIRFARPLRGAHGAFAGIVMLSVDTTANAAPDTSTPVANRPDRTRLI